MDHRTRNVFAVALVVVIVLTGGAALLLDGGDGPGPTQTPGVRPTDAPSMVGVIVGVDAQDLADVRAFTLRRGDDNQLVEFELGELRNGTSFPPGHLAEHQVTAEPVRVFYREDGETLFALWVDDAG